MKVQMLVLKFDLGEERMSPRVAEKVRGFVGRVFREELLHNHGEDGRFIYRYPRVQYKVVEGKPAIIAVNEGVPVVAKVARKVKEMQLDGEAKLVFEKEIKVYEEELGIAERMIGYCFLTTWFALNEENFRKYIESDAEGKRKLLERILIGNILSMCKSLGEFVEDKIEVAELRVVEREFFFKNIKFLGFKGRFAVNFKLPNFLGLGKSVSHGFGTIARIKECNQ